MPIDLYNVTASPPCRVVRLVAAAVGVDINLKNTDLSAGEHLKPEFLKMNPQHTVPTLDDNGFYLGESRAIITYLADQYGKNDSLYPKDSKKRAIVDQRLFFDMGTLYKSISDYYVITKDQKNYQKLCDAVSLLDTFLEGENYVAGKTLTVADLTLVVTISIVKLVEFDLSKYSNILKWYARIQAEAPKYKELESAGKVRNSRLYWSLNNGKTFSIVSMSALPLENLDLARGIALSRTKSFHGKWPDQNLPLFT